MLKIGKYARESRVVVAPMAGVTDRVFRDSCRAFGSYWTVSEMVTSDQRLWGSDKSRHRIAHHEEPGPRWVQLAGADAQMIADAAVANVALGADIIDINMGCPAKKVCNRAAGSALMRDESLVEDILRAVVASVDVPVTLKTRLGWSRDEMNAVKIATIAEDAGISLLTIHGRSRACRFKGTCDYDGIAQVKSAVGIPVIANGDIDSPTKAAKVLQSTGCDAVMIGRAAQGRPWLPAQIDRFLLEGVHTPDPDNRAILEYLANHLVGLYQLYGDYKGVRIARKHVGWTLTELGVAREQIQIFNRIETPHEQQRFVGMLFLEQLAA